MPTRCVSVSGSCDPVEVFSAAASERTDARRDVIFRRLFEAGIIGILFADTEGQIQRANDLFLEMVGYEREDLPLRWDMLTPPEWAPMDEVKRRELAETGIARPWEKEYWHRDGHRVPILLGVALLAGSETETVGFVLDRTEQVRQERRLQTLAAHIDVAEERERRRIAKGLHDEVGQNLALAKLKLDDLGRFGLTDKAGEALARVHQLLDRSVHACRGLTFELASPVLYELGLAAALEDLGHRVEEDHGIRCRIESRGPLREIDYRLGGVLFRIARELIHNVVKHSRAGHLEIQLVTSDDQIRLAMTDDGIGFEPGRVSGRLSGVGLVSARERLSRLDGRLEVDSAPGAGTRVEIVVPVDDGEAPSTPALRGDSGP